MNLKTKQIKLILFFLIFISIPTLCQVRLPKLIRDGMVLQRDAQVNIWGWASKNENISMHFIDSTYTTKADSAGDWNMQLSGLKPGGPFVMQIHASNTITVTDVMVGDVWVCSGQSNMELPMRRVSPLYENEIANSENISIRHFTMPQKYNFHAAQTDLDSGSWRTANPETVLSFSAAAYFFAKELYDTYKVPIGLINASLGGSPAESWISEEALKAFPEYYQEAQRFKDDSLIKKIEDQDRVRMQSWYNELRQKDEGYKNPHKSWLAPDLKTSHWATMKIPGYWSSTKLGAVNGVVWFRRELQVPAAMVGKQGRLILGRVVDADSVFINGAFIGSTSYQYPPRRYKIPSNVLKAGKNIIVVRVISNIGNGGFVPDKQYEIVVGEQKIDLKGAWKYRLGTAMNPLASQTFIRLKPLGLYNAMIAPLLSYRMKGAIWYQGEANAAKPVEYKELLPALIRDWRNNWKEGDFPFLFVQLPNFMETRSQPSESNWALMREAQCKTLSLPNTGMAVTIDIGEWNDIHPLNKKDVGKRLALAAQKVAYGDDRVVFSGPMYQSMKIDSNKIILSFNNVGGGLIVKGNGELKQFAIAGADKKFIWAKAKIENDKVIVWNESIAHPIAVRYAWADNPEGANLYNKEGLPASPFRTEE